MISFDTVSFDGIVITDMYAVVGVERQTAGVVNSTQEISGYDGIRITGSYIPSGTITVQILLKNMSVMERREEIRKIRALLQTDEPRELRFASDNGLYYMAKLDGDFSVAQHVRADMITVTFLLEQNILYGDVHTVTVPSGGSVSFLVSGTYKTHPSIVGSVSGDATNLMWGVRLDEGDYVRVKTGSTSPRDVSIDCDTREVIVNDEVSMITLNSDWLELASGRHTLRNDVGSGECTVTWQDRWL